MPKDVYPPGAVLMRPTLDALARNWWIIMLRGVAAVVFGLLAFVWPVITLFVLILMYGTFALFDGVLSIAAAVRGGGARWWLLLVGLLGIVVGAVTLAWPGVTGFVLLLFIAGWSIASGILQIVGGVRLRKEIANEWFLIASGVLSVLFGLLLAAFPGAGALGLVLAIGAFAVVYGVLLIGFSLRLRRHAQVKI